MTYIYLDPVGLQSFIDDLNDYAADLDDERATVQQVNSAEADPSDISLSVGLGSTIAQRHADLESVASELQTRLDEAVAMNESGVTPMDANGYVAYYLPAEGDGSEDTIENVQAYNSRSVDNARTDATALAQARDSRDGVADDGRTVDQILDEMAKHQDVPAYGASFVNTYGIERLIDEPLGLQWHYTSLDGTGATVSGPPDTTTDQAALDRANGILGHILAAATQTDAYPQGYSSWSEAMYQIATEEGHRGRMSSLNALLAAPGAVYDTETLVDLADRCEDLPFDGDGASRTPAQISGWHDDQHGYFYNEGRALAGSSMDPMYGVMMAMGNNPDAAHQYLTEGGGSTTETGLWVPSAETEERWTLLTGRSWDSDIGLDAFTAAQAAASSKRGAGDPDVAASATWATARSIKYAVDEVPSDQYTDAMKENYSVVVANCADGVVSVARGGSVQNMELVEIAEDADSETKESQEAEEANMMTSLIYRIIDNENAAATVSAAMTEHVVRNYGDVSGSSQLHSKYNEMGRVYGYLNAIGNERATDLAAADAEESRRAKESMGTALAVVTTIAGSGISGPVAPLLWSVGTTVTTPLVLDELAPGTLPDYDDLVEDGRDALESQAYVEAVNRGVLSGDDVYNPGNLQDDRGVLYDWVTEKDGALQLALPVNATASQNKQVHDWRYKIGRSDPEGVLGVSIRVLMPESTVGAVWFPGAMGREVSKGLSLSGNDFA